MLVPQISAILGAAIQDAEQMLGQLQGAKQLGENALQASNHVRQGSIDPVGAPQMQNALEEVDRAIVTVNSYIEQVRTYINTI